MPTLSAKDMEKGTYRLLSSSLLDTCAMIFVKQTNKITQVYAARSRICITAPGPHTDQQGTGIMTKKPVWTKCGGFEPFIDSDPDMGPAI